MQYGSVFDTIDAIHQAALEPATWPDALQMMADAVDATLVCLVPLDLGAPVPTFNSRQMIGAEQTYTLDWHARNSHRNTATQRGLQRGFVDVDSFWEGPDAVARDEFNHDYLVKVLGCLWDISYLVTPLRSDHRVTITALRSPKKEPFSKADKKLWQLLGKHAARSLTITAMLASGWQARQVSMQVLSGLECGVVMIGPGGTVDHMNASAAGMLEDAGPLVGRPLRTPLRPEQHSLDALLSAALSPDADPHLVGPVRLSRKKGRPVLVHAIALGGSMNDHLGSILTGGPSLLVFLIDPDRPPRALAADALTKLGLTQSESRIAALVGSGETVAASAQQLGITEHTARSTLKLVYDKLDLGRQSELVRLVTHMAAISRGGSAGR